ncbi:hypothetical protein F4776DRAFT_454907 [Hypoxylon sp. NC0597]|nr:hypothetical protein F4776DRAFT_454907 [Hypoxylon sp. NC0597]
MANLPSQHPHLSLHLTDRALTPLITSSRTRPQLDALTSLSHGALNAHESALRLSLGSPQRIMVEHADGGPVLLQSFLRADAPAHPHISNTNTNTTATATANPSSSSSATAGGATTANGQPSAEHSEAASPVSPSTEASPTSAVERRLQQLQLHGSNSVALDEPGATTPTLDVGEEDANAPPMLVGLVVAPGADEARDARRAAARLERVGREIQARWAEAQMGPDGEGEREGGGSGTGGAGDTGD